MTKSGRRFYEIRVSRGRSKSYLSTRWYVPEGWSQKAIDKELTKVAAEFERQVKSGEIISREEQKKTRPPGKTGGRKNPNTASV